MAGAAPAASVASGLPNPPISRSFLAVANYSPNQTVYRADLDRFSATWWLGGVQLTDPNQIAMLRAGYHYLPSFNTGYVMRSQGLTAVPAGITRAHDPHSCLDRPCPLNNPAILADVATVQSTLGGSGNYYNIGNEVDNSNSDGVAPSVYGGQFDTWVSAIKQGDATAKIVAPSMAAWSCCTKRSTNPFGTAGAWFKAFVSSYRRHHGGSKPPIDVLSMHLYNYDPNTGTPSGAAADSYLGEVRSFRRAADARGYTGTPIWITELGFLYPPARPLTQAQRRQIKRTVNQLAGDATALHLERLFWFTDNNLPAADGLRPLYSPDAASSPGSAMPASDLGQLIADLVRPAAPGEAAAPRPRGECVVPLLAGHSLAGARFLLAAAGCVLGQVRGPSAADLVAARRRTGGKTPPVVVVSQNPVARAKGPGGWAVAVQLRGRS